MAWHGRYVLLLREMIKHTWESHADLQSGDATAALASLEVIATGR
jgi:hypothetical protein